MKYEWIICTLDDAEDKLKEMRADGWHPISHSIWVDTCEQRMVSFLFKKKESTTDTAQKAKSSNVLKFIKQRVDDLNH